MLNIEIPLRYVRRTVVLAEVLNRTRDRIGLGLSDLSDSDRRHGVYAKNIGRVWLHVRDGVIDRDHLRDDRVLKVHRLLRRIVKAPSSPEYSIFHRTRREGDSDSGRP